MKPLLLVVVLTCLCIMKVSAQQNLKKPKYSKDNGYSYSSELAMNFNSYAEALKQQDPPKLHINPDQLPSRRPPYFRTSRPPLTDHMPVIRPKGYFHGIVIKPDTTIDYKLLIRKP